MAKKKSFDPVLLQKIMKGLTEARAAAKPGCFLFNRVSTKMEEQETSLEQQELDSKKYVEGKGFHVVHNFRVQETASKEDKRHVFNSMVEILKSDLIDVKHVVFKSADRSLRNRRDMYEFEVLRKKHGVSIHYYSSGKIMHGESHYTDELQNDVEAVFAAHFSRELSDKIKRANLHKAIDKKQAPGTHPPFGYFWERNEKKHVIDKESKPIVRAIHNAFDTGRYSLNQFVEYCNGKKLLPKSGIRWEKGRMEKFLKNPFYCGWFRFKGGVYEGSHPTYISKKRFDERLERLGERRNGNPEGRKGHLLSKFIKCSECGRVYIGEIKTGAHNSGHYTYYRHKCPIHKKEGELRYTESEMLKAIDEQVRVIRYSDEFAQNLKNLFKKPLEKSNKTNRKELEVISARINRLNVQKSRLLDLFTLEEIDKSELVEKRKEYDTEIEILQTQWNALHKDNKDIFDQIVEIIDLIKEMPLIYLRDTSDGKIKVLKTMVESMTIKPSGYLTLNWLRPYSFMMRAEMLEAIEKKNLKPLTVKKSGFDKVSFCARRGT